MAAVQHVYSGDGDPNGVVLVASLGAHYIDLAASLAWTCVSAGEDGGANAVWARPAGSGGDDTVIEHITTDIHTRFFGKPSTAPSRVGQLCRQIDVNGRVCEWVAHVSWDETLRWGRSVLPMADWGIAVPDSFSATIAGTDRAFAATKDAHTENPILTTLALPQLVPSGDDLMLEHWPLPLVFANWSSQTWTLELNPSLFWEAGGMAVIQATGFEALGMTWELSGPENSRARVVIPANTRTWIDLNVWAGTNEEGGWVEYEMFARPLNITSG